MAEAWSSVSGAHPLDEETIVATAGGIQKDFKPWHQLSVQECRDQFDEMLVAMDDAMPCGGTVEEMTIPASGSQPAIPIFVHTPSNKPAVPVIIIYHHGGGLVIGSARGYRKAAQLLAEKCEAIVVNVEYRLLPNQDDPLACFNDVTAAAKWILENKEAVGGAKNSVVGVVGDSAGGQLSCCVTHDVKGMAFQVLIYPVVGMDCTVPSFKEFYDTPLFNGKDMEMMFKVTLSGVPDADKNPRVNPAANENLSASPPTLIISVELDPLLDWALEYEKKLKAAQVPVKLVFFPGLAHGLFCSPGVYLKSHASFLEEIRNFVKSFQ